MRVYGLNGTGAVTVLTSVRRPAPDSFGMENVIAERAATGAAAPRLVGGIDAPLAFRGFEDPSEQRRRAVMRGRTALHALDALKLGLLTGRLQTRTLAVLKSVAAELADRTGEPGLDTLLAEIELRVSVELAKIGMPSKDGSFP